MSQIAWIASQEQDGATQNCSRDMLSASGEGFIPISDVLRLGINWSNKKDEILSEICPPVLPAEGDRHSNS
jgi:hypothetical protein